jgi:hypothetical protein
MQTCAAGQNKEKKGESHSEWTDAKGGHDYLRDRDVHFSPLLVLQARLECSNGRSSSVQSIRNQGLEALLYFLLQDCLLRVLRRSGGSLSRLHRGHSVLAKGSKSNALHLIKTLKPGI